MLARVAIGHVIREKRQFLFMTLRDLSASAHLALSFLSEIERGKKEASSETLSGIALALGMTSGDLLVEAGFLIQEMERLTAPVPVQQARV